MGDEERRIKPEQEVARLVDEMRKKQKRPPAPEEHQDAERRRQVQRNRVMYDLPLEISQAIKALSNQLECPESQVAGLLLFYALRHAATGAINWDDYLVLSSSPKHKYNLRFASISEE